MKESRILYQGPVTSIVPHFGNAGYHCPSNYNPADFLMSLCQMETVEVLEEKKAYSLVLPELEGVQESLRLGDSVVEFNTERAFTTQLSALVERETINVYRDTNALIGRFVISAILNLLFALIFLNAGGRGNDTTEDFNSHFGAISMCLISGMFASAQTVMLSFPYERPMFLREYSTGTCKSQILQPFLFRSIRALFLTLLSSFCFQFQMVWFLTSSASSFWRYR